MSLFVEKSHAWFTEWFYIYLTVCKNSLIFYGLKKYPSDVAKNYLHVFVNFKWNETEQLIPIVFGVKLLKQ